MEPHHLSEEASTKLLAGIRSILLQWSSLQVAVQNEFGGRDSLQRYQQLPHEIFLWLTHATGTINDLDNMLDDFMLDLNTELEDGSIEEISEKLLILHEECLKGDAPGVPDPHMQQDTAASDGSSVEKHAETGVGASESQPNGIQNDMMMENAPLLDKTAKAEDGWTVVTRRQKPRKKELA